MQSNRYNVMRKSSASVPATGTPGTDLYDLWLNSRLPTVTTSLVTGVTSSSSHQLDGSLDSSIDRGITRDITRDIGRDIDSERLAEKLMQLSLSEMPGEAVEERL